MAASETTSRPFLPHTMSSQGVSFIPSNSPKEAVQRNYVFVDEHNRHKRLKVMRACEGCRKRKIKCDSATTNIWPCAACVRLKLQCVPPSINDEQDSNIPGVHTFELLKREPSNTETPLGISDFDQQYLQQFERLDPHPQQSLGIQYGETSVYHQTSYVKQPSTEMNMVKYDHMSAPQPINGLKSSPVSSQRPDTAPSSSPEAHVGSLAEAFGDLAINVNGTSPYIADQTKLAETPAVQEREVDLPPIMSIPSDNRVRIPSEMMPNDSQALKYFEYFFTHVHPYVPVLCEADFYRQWNTARDSLPPLVLEGIFACTTAMLGQRRESSQWLALANKHEEHYRDSPRLSTVQAMLLLLKARESHPRRGYFYRSWVSVVHAIAMAKDLGINQHQDAHETNSCHYGPVECVARTRIWQVLFVLECMIGGPQGRLDFNVRYDSVDFEEPRIIAGINAQERQISRQYVYLSKLAYNVRHTLEAYRDGKKKKGVGWGLEPSYLALDNTYVDWFNNLPLDLQISIPDDGSEPSVANPFVSDMHRYGYLSIITHHRPQIHYLMLKGETNSWKPYMMACLDAAKKICRLHESMMRSYGSPIFTAMLRGLSFTIYAILTCTMLHLAAVTAPDPDINYDATDYFVRSMRMLEKFSVLWPMDVVQKQIDTLREAFSADINKPFELKASFPFGSPSPQASQLPVTSGAYTQSQPDQIRLITSRQPGHNISHSVTPSPTISGDRLGANQMDRQINHIISHPATTSAAYNEQALQQHWNPTPIFDKWLGAFYTGNVTVTEQLSPTSTHITSPTDIDLSPHGFSQTTYPTQTYTSDTGLHLSPTVHAPTSYPCHSGIDFYSPSAWQDVVASSYGSRSKRAWDAANLGSGMNRHPD